jgi:hypothetical protein
VLLNEAVCVRQIRRQAKNKHFFLLFHPYLSSLPTTEGFCCTVACSILLITTGSSSIICCSPRILTCPITNVELKVLSNEKRGGLTVILFDII